MRELFRAEARRLGPVALVGAALHLIVVAPMSRVVDLLQQPLAVHQLFAGST